MPRFAVIHTYEYTRTRWVEARNADEASDFANGTNTSDKAEWVESDVHTFVDETVQEEE